MASAENLRSILDGLKQRQADAEYEINRLELKLTSAKLERESALDSIEIVERLLAKDEGR
jgi:hypothetical protein